ncbi:MULTISPECIES: hypothetical protein [Streptomyces]|uniref:Uncharacterized protein n=1 Tax=Streptomyces changanensis TaxID=2964669 RepID=A0ABY5N2T7_9ACTN|nr:MULTISPECIES: hypothetical protein [Streptomyces]UUS30844.1 hypothetical protein NRO40_08340 [Streptomyces changanensis]
MALRKTIPTSELRDRLAPEKREQHATDYHGSRGGWLRPKDKPVPGTPKKS